MGHYDSQIREQHYRLAMEELGLPVYENSIFYGDMWKGKGEQAYEFFFSDETHRPEAIVCANDFMGEHSQSRLKNTEFWYRRMLWSVAWIIHRNHVMYFRS